MENTKSNILYLEVAKNHLFLPEVGRLVELARVEEEVKMSDVHAVMLSIADGLVLMKW